jgi:hypothetical protein
MMMIVLVRRPRAASSRRRSAAARTRSCSSMRLSELSYVPSGSKFDVGTSFSRFERSTR